MRLSIVNVSSPLLLLSTFGATSSAFSTPSLNVPRQTSTQLNVGASIPLSDEEAAQLLMADARECAFSDSCSLEEAESYLNGVLHIQSGCAGGILSGHDLCEDQLAAAEVVSNLRAKIDSKSGLVPTAVNTVAKVSAAMPALAATGIAVAMLGMLLGDAQGAAPFTVQEWYWSIRDGYFPLMVAQFFKNGGLASLEDTTQLTLQEWTWAMRDGYLPVMMDHFFKNGGLSSLEGSTTGSFTLQEWSWAARDGYFPAMMDQFFKNGGIASLDDSTKMTMQEWNWALRDGYLPLMMEQFIKNGGLASV